MSDDPAFHAAMEKVGTELTWATAWEDVSVDEIIRLALEAARPIIEAEAVEAAADRLRHVFYSTKGTAQRHVMISAVLGNAIDPEFSRAAVRTEPEK